MVTTRRRALDAEERLRDLPSAARRGIARLRERFARDRWSRAVRAFLSPPRAADPCCVSCFGARRRWRVVLTPRQRFVLVPLLGVAVVVALVAAGSTTVVVAAMVAAVVVLPTWRVFVGRVPARTRERATLTATSAPTLLMTNWGLFCTVRLVTVVVKELDHGRVRVGFTSGGAAVLRARVHAAAALPDPPRRCPPPHALPAPIDDVVDLLREIEHVSAVARLRPWTRIAKAVRPRVLREPDAVLKAALSLGLVEAEGSAPNRLVGLSGPGARFFELHGCGTEAEPRGRVATSDALTDAIERLRDHAATAEVEPARANDLARAVAFLDKVRSETNSYQERVEIAVDDIVGILGPPTLRAHLGGRLEELAQSFVCFDRHGIERPHSAAIGRMSDE